MELGGIIGVFRLLVLFKGIGGEAASSLFSSVEEDLSDGVVFYLWVDSPSLDNSSESALLLDLFLTSPYVGSFSFQTCLRPHRSAPALGLHYHL